MMAADTTDTDYRRSHAALHLADLTKFNAEYLRRKLNHDFRVSDYTAAAGPASTYSRKQKRDI